MPRRAGWLTEPPVNIAGSDLVDLGLSTSSVSLPSGLSVLDNDAISPDTLCVSSRPVSSDALEEEALLSAVMTRQNHLHRLAFGKSAFELPDRPHATTAKSEDDPESTHERQQFGEHVQEHDDKGHSINDASGALKRKLHWAQNDVLATVGICSRINDEQDLRQLKEAASQASKNSQRQNRDCTVLDIVDATLLALENTFFLAIRQKCQVFQMSLEAPLTTVVFSGWRQQGFLRSWYPGATSNSVVFCLSQLRVTIPELLREIALGPLSGISGRNNVRTKPFMSNIHYSQTFFFGPIMFLLLSPLEVYAALQRLDIIPAWPLLPGITTYTALLADLTGLSHQAETPLGWASLFRHILTDKSMALWAFLLYLPVYTKARNTIRRYSYTTLPKVPNSSSFTVTPARNLLLHFQAWRINHVIFDHWHRANYQVVLASDLQAIGRNWQRFWDGMVRLLRSPRSFFPSRANGQAASHLSRSHQSSISSIQDLPDDLREVMESMASPNIPAVSSDDVLGMPPELQDLLDPLPRNNNDERIPARLLHSHSSSPLAVEVLSVAPEEGTTDAQPSDDTNNNQVAVPSQDQGHEDPQQASSSRSQSPSQNAIPQVEITARRSNDGHQSLELSIPVDEESEIPGFQVPTGTSTGTADCDSFSSAPENPEGSIEMYDVSLADYPSHSLVNLVSLHLTDLVLLPLEALFVRSVALATWSAPGLLTGSRSFGETGRDAVYAPGMWFGLGLRAGGWRGFRNYASKMLLISGLRLAVGLTIWELEYHLIRWRGRKRYNWKA